MTAKEKKKTPRIKEAETTTPHRFDDVNKRFTEIRLKHQESQEDWGKHFGLRRTSISSIELNRQAVPIYVMQVLHRKFNIDLNWLICGDEPKGTASADVQILERKLDAEVKAHNVSRERLEDCLANNKALRIALGVS